MISKKYVGAAHVGHAMDYDLTELLKDSSLTKEEKMKALVGWENAQNALLRADDESMSCKTAEKLVSPAEKIRRIQKAGRELSDQLCVGAVETTTERE